MKADEDHKDQQISDLGNPSENRTQICRLICEHGVLSRDR